MPKDLNAEGVSVVFVDHFDRAVVLGLKRVSFAQEPIGCTINVKWKFRHGRGVQKRTNTWSAWCSTFRGRTIGMRKDTRAWVLHEGFAELRTM